MFVREIIRSTYRYFQLPIIYNISHLVLLKKRTPSPIISCALNLALWLARDKKLLLEILIKRTQPLKIDNNSQVAIHSVVCHNDIVQYILTLKSFIFFSKVKASVVVHDDGSLTLEDQKQLNYHFPEIEIITYEYATKTVRKSLQKYPHIKKERLRKSWNKFQMLIMLDVPFFAKKKKLVYFDSDILFYKFPQQIMNWVNTNNDSQETWYTAAEGDAYTIDRELLTYLYKKKAIPGLNSGFRCFWKRSLNLEAMEKFLKLLEGLKKNDAVWRDQTYAMIDTIFHYKRSKKFNMSTHIISLYPLVKPETIFCHYITPIRWQLYSEGSRLLTHQMITLFK